MAWLYQPAKEEWNPCNTMQPMIHRPIFHSMAAYSLVHTICMSQPWECNYLVVNVVLMWLGGGVGVPLEFMLICGVGVWYVYWNEICGVWVRVKGQEYRGANVHVMGTFHANNNSPGV
ncbi:hypothetical protein EDC04DRAFT_2608163 [Pisolithus marmoratus]|nr:hypothetical protein EDC04DRAFT_2608163 [Pisolithus marmoratus]